MNGERETGISPWDGDVTVPSPDRTKTARIENAVEVGMGAPTSGRLVLSTGLVLEGCSPSMVWSDDSRYLAIPRWDRPSQRLVVIDTHTAQFRTSRQLYRVIKLMSFANGVVAGIDSPAHLPKVFTVDISEPFHKPVREPGLIRDLFEGAFRLVGRILENWW